MLKGFEAKQALPGVFHIHNTLAVDVYCTLLIGSRSALLIDTAVGLGDLPSFVRGLTELPLTVMNTHGHIDHCGGDADFDEAFMDAEDIPGARRCLTDREVRGRLLDMAGADLPAGFSREKWLERPAGRLRELEPGKVWDLGGLTAQTIPLRTHSSGSVCVYCPERELLIGGDAVSPMACLVFPDSCTTAEHADALRAVEAFPFSHLLSGHSERLIPRAEVSAYIACARSIREDESVRCRDPLFPEFPGRLFCYHGDDGMDAAIMYDPSRVGTGSRE